MIQRLYIHNFRCLENFELNLKGLSSALSIGKNGSGKSTIGSALKILQKICKGNFGLRELLNFEDLSYERSEIPIRFEIDVLLDQKLYHYNLALLFDEKNQEFVVFEETMKYDGEAIYSREKDLINLRKGEDRDQTEFSLDPSRIALPIIQQPSKVDRIRVFREWLSRMIILNPVPSLMTGESQNEILEINIDGYDFGAWFSGLLRHYPSAYIQIDKYLREVIPDLDDIENEMLGTRAKRIKVKFQKDTAVFTIPFKNLSDGEKCFFLCAVVLAANKAYGPLFCFWDEPDNYLAPSEVGHFILSLRRGFKEKGQFLATSHNPEAIRHFSDENTFFLDRKSHLEPTLIKLLSEIPFTGDLTTALLLGDIEL